MNYVRVRRRSRRRGSRRWRRVGAWVRYAVPYLLLAGLVVAVGSWWLHQPGVRWYEIPVVAAVFALLLLAAAGQP